MYNFDSKVKNEMVKYVPKNPIGRLLGKVVVVKPNRVI